MRSRAEEDKVNLIQAKRIVGEKSKEELKSLIQELEAKDFLWLESDINLLRASKIVLRRKQEQEA
jgi:hypothetical protein